MSSSCASRSGTRTQKIPSRVLSSGLRRSCRPACPRLRRRHLTLDSAAAKRGCRPACATVVLRPGPVACVDRPVLPHPRAVAPGLRCPLSISSRQSTTASRPLSSTASPLRPLLLLIPFVEHGQSTTASRPSSYSYTSARISLW
jgi:hypothetical protein